MSGTERAHAKQGEQDLSVSQPLASGEFLERAWHAESSSSTLFG
jgi:hypothetical protein